MELRRNSVFHPERTRTWQAALPGETLCERCSTPSPQELCGRSPQPLVDGRLSRIRSAQADASAPCPAPPSNARCGCATSPSRHTRGAYSELVADTTASAEGCGTARGNTQA
jgi:hypothetical protein